MELSKIEFETLWNIEKSLKADPVKASNDTKEDIEKYNEIFNKLQELGLIEIEIRDGAIYGAILTQKGREVLEDKRYQEWIEIFLQ